MMPVLLIILAPLAALLICAVVFDLRQRRRLGASGSHDISSVAHMARAISDVKSSQHGTGGGGVGGI
jgi:hypothetical protein